MANDTRDPVPTANTQSGNETTERQSSRGEGGETHQTPTGKTDRLTTSQGVPVSDNQNSLKAGSRGPVLMEDFHFREKMFHFDHERIPERVVHARGYGAHGYFETTEAIPELTSAHLLQKKGRKVPAFVR
ncbi:MAG: catalase, partial [Hyphomicrobiales bacterium]